jgi:TatD DNase family protein
MHYIDSHAHLADVAFDPDRDDVIGRARDAGAAAIVSIGESIAAAGRAAVIAAKHPRYHSPRDAQRHAFELQLQLATELDRPVVVHSREADADITAMIDTAARAGAHGVLHCFTGPHAVAEAALSVGWYVSFSGIVTFKKWDDLALLRLVPDDRLLVESDAPYLAPVPFRGKRNEPSFVRYTIERLASARGTTSDALAELTANNTRRFFGLAMADPRS